MRLVPRAEDGRLTALGGKKREIERKNEFVNRVSRDLRRELDMTRPANNMLLARNIFVFGQCMEGTQFYGLFGMVLSLYRQNKFPGIGQMFRYTLRDESNHIEVFRNLFMDLVEENREILRRPGGRGHDWFAGVVPNKNYVSFYMLPIYTWPHLLDGMSPALRKRKQGASCFNFSAVDEDQMAELATLTERSFQAYMSGGASLAEGSPAAGASVSRYTL